MGTDKKNLPKLELKLGEEARVKLLRDKCYEGTNRYGPYYLYNVTHEGVEKSFFAPLEIHELIVKHGLKTGSEFILRKVAEQNGLKVTAHLSFEPVQTELRAPSTPSGNGHADNFKAIMQQSLQDAIEITKAVNSIPFQNEDIRAISSCLFIARTRINGHN